MTTTTQRLARSQDPTPFVALDWHENARIAAAVSRFIYLVGEPGVGKSHFVQALSLSMTGQPCESITAGLDTKAHDFWGGRELVDGNTVFVPGPLARALRNGSFLEVKEVGLLPNGMLGTLLDLRHVATITNPINQEVYEVPDSFRVAMTANPANVSCRQHGEALQALIDAAIGFEVPDLDARRLREMLLAHEPDTPVETLERAIRWWRVLSDAARQKEDEAKIRLNFRSVHQFVTAVAAGMREEMAAEACFAIKFVRKPELHKAIKLRIGFGIDGESVMGDDDERWWEGDDSEDGGGEDGDSQDYDSPDGDRGPAPDADDRPRLR